MANRNIFPLIMSLFLLSGLAIAITTFSGYNPDDNWDTSDRTPRFCITPASNESSLVNMTLYINDTGFGETLSHTNGTEICMTVNATLPYNTYLWKFGSFDITQTNSTARTITISQFGSVTQVIQSVVTIFGSLVFFIISTVVLIVGIIVISFVLTLIASIFSGIKGKVGKGFK